MDRVDKERGFSGGVDGRGRFRRAVPGQELLDAVDGMIGDAGQYVSEIHCGVEAVEFGGADQAVDRGGSPPGEQIILPAQGHDTQRSLGGVVVHFDAAVVHVAQ